MMEVLTAILLLVAGFVLARLLMRAFMAPQGRDVRPRERTEPAASAEEVDPAHIDPIDEQSLESFPASDPPSFTGTTVWPRDGHSAGEPRRRTGSG